MTQPHHDLETIQRWMQSVITYPGGVVAGVETEAAQRQIEISSAQIEEVVTRSEKLSGLDRLDVYASAYFARLMECLRSEFPVLVMTIGEDLFDEFVVGYLNHYPSRSYTLGHLGAKFANYLAETCPREDEHATTWADFLIDLARLEWAFNEVFDGPGIENLEQLDAAQLQAVSPEQWPATKLVVVPCLRLMTFRYPVSQFYGARRHDPSTPPPAPQDSYVAISRRNFVVRRFELSRVQFDLFSRLAEGLTIGDAIAASAASSDEAFDELAANLQDWFREWASESLFLRLELPD